MEQKKKDEKNVNNEKEKKRDTENVSKGQVHKNGKIEKSNQIYSNKQSQEYIC